MLIRSLLLVCLITLSAVAVQAQPTERPGPNEANIPSYRMEQHDKWLNNETSFPAKERNMWQVAVNTGSLRIGGDVRSEWGYGFGLSVRKALGYTVSVRARYTAGDAYGLNSAPSTGIAFNPAVNGVNNPVADYYNETSGYGEAYLNYKNRMHDLGVDAIININNIKFHKEKNFFAPYVFFGVGAMTYNTMVDQVDANGNSYDYESVPSGNTQDQIKYVKGILDRDYETEGEDNTKSDFRFNGQAANITLSGGLGLGFRLTDRFEVGLEHRMTWTGDDLLDGVRYVSERTYEGPKPVPTQGRDLIHYTSFILGVNLGKNAQEPTWYVNPIDYTYDYLSYLEEKTNFKDGDEDGVPDLWDQELDSPEGAVVDTKGITKDSDGDGCPDHEDPEPFSSPQYEIVDCKTQWPQPLSEERVVELIKENSIDGWFFPTIHFETNKSKILTEFYDDMQHVGDMMNRYKNINVDVIGHTDYRASEQYNIGLSQRRAEAAVNFLVENYGISRDRFNIKYEGESQELIKGGRSEKEMYMNRRVEFKVTD